MWFVKGDSPQCGEMSRSDRGDGRQLGGSGVAAGGDCTGGVTKGAFGVLFYLRHNTGNKIIHSNRNNTKKHRSNERCFMFIFSIVLT